MNTRSSGIVISRYVNQATHTVSEYLNWRGLAKHTQNPKSRRRIVFQSSTERAPAWKAGFKFRTFTPTSFHHPKTFSLAWFLQGSQPRAFMEWRIYNMWIMSSLGNPTHIHIFGLPLLLNRSFLSIDHQFILSRFAVHMRNPPYARHITMLTPANQLATCCSGYLVTIFCY